MKRRIARKLTILIARTGKEPIVLMYPHLLARCGIALFVGLLVFSVTSLVHSYTHQRSQLVDRNLELVNHNSQLSRRNSALAKEAMHILQQVESLETQIQELRHRAGLPDAEPNAMDEQSLTPQPRAGAQHRAETVLNLVKARLPQLVQEVRHEVKPTLQQTLAWEEAQPQGLPLGSKVEISSRYGWRSNPFGWSQEFQEFHQGIDFVAPYGSPVHATAAGVVQRATWDEGFGNYVVIEHSDTHSTLYAHLAALKVGQGTQVRRYQVIGYLGSTGRSSGPHLHYEVHRHDRPIDPAQYLGLNSGN
jgi:murein DD-endopeptidase MepM/ murein hydrolase activator NlpD